MRRMKSFFLIASVCMILSGCSSGYDSEKVKSEESVTAAVNEEKYEIALVSFFGTTQDHSFGQATWEGIQLYAKEHDITYKLYQPEEATSDNYIEKIDLAVENGAKIIVCPGFLFETPVFIEQDKYPDVKFVLIDGQPHNASYTETRINDNVLSLVFSEEQAGFLAGYAAVKDGYKKLAFMGGMAVPSVIRYGYGFVQGCNLAAEEMGIKVEITYNYTGTFFESPEIKSIADDWYHQGTQVIFACGGAIGKSVMKSAEENKAKVIGVDLDQSSESETVITSAMKMLKPVVYDVLKDYYTGSFHGGAPQTYSVKNNGIGLPMETSKFSTFSKQEYDAIFGKLAAGNVIIYNKTDDSTTADLNLAAAKVIYLK
ncbi:MAG: BMP family ABC transporter substrate-binding protein [Paenibacillaceae bacterium]|nr:BMP family ABC transporter substrate-binding protein [Paenibacillaceae bacterium]